MEGGEPSPSQALACLDPLVMGKIISKSSWATRLQLERTCKHICTVARQLHPLSIQLRGDEGTYFCRVPPARAFKGCTSLSYIMTSTGSSLLAMTAALGYAAMYCPHLAAVKLQFEVPAGARAVAAQHGWTVDMKMALEETCLVGALSALQLMTSLRTLELLPLWFSRVTCQSLAALTALTSLRLGVPPYVADCYIYGDLSALASLTNLTHLVLEDMRLLPTPVSSSGGGLPSVGSSGSTSSVASYNGTNSGSSSSSSWFPSSLQELVLAPRIGTHHWLPHVQACNDLQSLVLHYPGTRYSWQAHPAVVVQSVAGSLSRLTRLEFQGGTDGVSWDLEGAPPEVADAVAGPGISSELIVPAAALSSLTRLCDLKAGAGFRLAVTSDAHWHHLAACSSLRSLDQLQAFCVPPSGVVLTSVTRIGALVNGPVTPVYELLERCPALEDIELDYDISPIFEGWINERGPCRPQLAATLRFRTLSCYILAALMQQLMSCRSLDLLWALGDRLPDLGPMPALEKLVLRWQPGADNAPRKQVFPEDILHMLHGCKVLQELEVHHVHFMTARYALMLQYQHPELRLLKLVGCGNLEGSGTGPSDPDRLQRVQQLLRQGLQVVEESPVPRVPCSSAAGVLG